ncbi:E3 ubiquitin-protein ligase KCMF1-like [Centruroides sculpturatus]|uniref:E3 ubiquitin-protein ligase KCMF1-like n=1 Tax=Centruroides sculpturatus TaxID=218467 RepID=UPI000C6DBCFE|nr:E3 ubiquitin-protein ligase KCMF1-like [Centruroides sculpturatus]
MSRHEGVSCDSCLKGNFRGKRYKCLICYDYDLCATCYEAGATTTRHTTEHPMQCILTRADFDLYYGGEAISVDQPQAYTCPFCGKTGFTETTLHEHVTSEHPDTSFEVVCPVCAALPGGEPNNVTDDFAAHLTLEHRTPRDLDDSSSSRQVRRIPHPGRGMSSARPRRSQMQFTSSGLSSLSPSSRESMDPIAELLSQLSGVRRTSNLAQSSTASTTTTQLQQLQMQLQLERQQAQAARQQLDRLPRRQSQIGSGMVTGNSGASSGGAVAGSSGAVLSHCTIVLEPTPSPAIASSASSQFLLSRCMDPSLSESEQQNLEIESADRSLFVQELLLTSLSEQFANTPDWDAIGKKLGLRLGSEPSEFSYLQSAAIAGVNQDESVDEITNSVSQDSVQCSSITQQNQSVTSQLHQTLGQPSQINQPLRSSGTSRRSPNLGSSSLRQSGRRGGGSGTNLQLSGNSQSYRVGAPSHLQQLPTRDGLSSSRNRSTTGRDSGTSPSAARRKVVRQVDDRNKSSEPPPPH